MKTPLIFALFACALAPTLAMAAPSEFTPPDKSFTVNFPGEPLCGDKKLKAPTGSLTIRICSLTDARSKLTYSVAQYYRAQIVSKNNPRLILRAALDLSIVDSNGVLVDVHDTEIGGFPGIESLTKVVSSGQQTAAQYLLVNEKIFVAEIAGLHGRSPQKEVNAFFDSLKIGATSRRKKE